MFSCSFCTSGQAATTCLPHSLLAPVEVRQFVGGTGKTTDDSGLFKMVVEPLPWGADACFWAADVGGRSCFAAASVGSTTSSALLL